MDRNTRDRARRTWNGIKNRCYNTKCKDYKSYGGKGVVICDEWLDFDTFYKWYCDNYYEVDGEYMAIDKDVLGGNIYSPETCIMLPFRINGLFVHKNEAGRGLQKVGNKYQVKVRNNGINEYCGTYESVEVASNVYKECKEVIIRGVALEYKDKLPESIFQTLYNFKL